MHTYSHAHTHASATGMAAATAATAAAAGTAAAPPGRAGEGIALSVVDNVLVVQLVGVWWDNFADNFGWC